MFENVSIPTCFPGNHMSDKESVEELPSHITKDLPHTMTQHKHLQLLLQQRYLNQATNSDPKPNRHTDTAVTGHSTLPGAPDRLVRWCFIDRLGSSSHHSFLFRCKSLEYTYIIIPKIKKQEPLLIDSAGTAEKFSSYINFLTDV